MAQHSTHPPPPLSHLPVLVAFFSILCSLIFQQLHKQSNGPFKLPASCICKKKIMPPCWSVCECGSAELRSHPRTLDAFPLKS